MFRCKQELSENYFEKIWAANTYGRFTIIHCGLRNPTLRIFHCIINSISKFCEFPGFNHRITSDRVFTNPPGISVVPSFNDVFEDLHKLMRFRYRIIINGNRSDVNKKIHKFKFVNFLESWSRTAFSFVVFDHSLSVINSPAGPSLN